MRRFLARCLHRIDSEIRKRAKRKLDYIDILLLKTSLTNNTWKNNAVCFSPYQDLARGLTNKSASRRSQTNFAELFTLTSQKVLIKSFKRVETPLSFSYASKVKSQ